MIDLTIRDLHPGDASVIASMLLEAADEYVEYFYPFEFSQSAIRKEMEESPEDRYWGIWCGGALQVVFMLRGLGKGYSSPAYGVFVSEEVEGLGLGRLSLVWCFAWCRLNGISEVMLKVHKENLRAETLYKSLGFERMPESEGDTQWVYRRSL